MSYGVKRLAKTLIGISLAAGGFIVPTSVGVPSSLVGMASPAEAQVPPGWDQVNQDGFVPGQGPTSSGTELFRFDGRLYALNEFGLFRMDNPATRLWTQVNPPAAPSGPGAVPPVAGPVGDYLYAWNAGQLYWVPKGAVLSDSWNKVTPVGIASSPIPFSRITKATIFRGKLYGFVYVAGGTFEIWRTGDIGKTTATWERVVTNSFGDPTNNRAVDVMIVFNNHVYVGTQTLAANFGTPADYGDGVEIWESASGDLGTWAQVNVDGFGTLFNGCIPNGGPCYFALHQVIGSAAVYQPPGSPQEYLYIGTLAHFGAEVWRYDGTGPSGWVNVTPPWAGPGIGSSPGRNWALVPFQDDLYLVEGFPSANLGVYDGTDWSVLVEGDHPFDPDNGGLTSATVFENRLYVSTLHGVDATQGDQVWRYTLPPPITLNIPRTEHTATLLPTARCSSPAATTTPAAG